MHRISLGPLPHGPRPVFLPAFADLGPQPPVVISIPGASYALAVPRRRVGRVVEGAPLLRVYGSKAHRGFESLTLRHIRMKKPPSRGLFHLYWLRVRESSVIPSEIGRASCRERV